MMMSEHKGTKRTKVIERAAPPGFESLTSFTLKRTQRNNGDGNLMGLKSDTEPEPTHIEASSKIVNIEKLQKSLNQRPWILPNQLINSQKLDIEHHNTNVSLENSLPKGVIRGCSSCNDCQKVTARWRPEQPSSFVIDHAPIFHPTEEEFKDTLQYIAKIRPKAEEYGICRIVPPYTWLPKCLIKEKKVWEASRFHTRVQQIDELQYLHSKKELHRLNEQVKRNRKTSNIESDYKSGDFEFECGPEFTLQTFKTYADQFKGQYFQMESDLTDVSTFRLEIVEGEYWRIVQNPTEQIQVLSAHNLEADVIGSGFPLPPNSELGNDDRSDCMKSGWNLNNTPKLPGSLLAFERSDSSPTSAPRVDVGMCFSSLCWRVEEHRLYSLSYMHTGATRIWYGIPNRYYFKLAAVLKKAFPELSGHPELYRKLVTQLSPSMLKSEGIPVYRCVHYPNEFILIFPGAYHSGFDCGFNVSERVNLAPFDWLSHGQTSVEIYSELRRKTSISYDKMLMEGAINTVKASWLLQLTRDSERWKNTCGKNGLLTRALKSRVKWESLRRECLCNASQSQTMEEDFGCSTKRECVVCFFDLYLSATSCPCSPDKFSCLEHSKQLCTCPWSSRIFLFRYDISELNLLVDASEGKLNALYRWARNNRQLFSSSQMSGNVLEMTLKF